MRPTLLLVLGLLTAAPCAARAADREERTYGITADGKRAGNLVVVIEDAGNGVTTAKYNVDVSVRVLLRDYKYSLRGFEVWNKDQLTNLETQTNDDGKKMDLKVEPDPNGGGFQVTIGNRRGIQKADIWTTSYWREPGDGKKVLMDADTGNILNAKWDKVGVEAVSVMGQKVNCTHYRVGGATKAELWYDGSQRLVRQEVVESGVRMVTEIREYKKGAAQVNRANSP